MHTPKNTYSSLIKFLINFIIFTRLSPAQVFPSPVNPALQEQIHEPGVFRHLALTSQTGMEELHSSMSIMESSKQPLQANNMQTIVKYQYSKYTTRGKGMVDFSQSHVSRCLCHNFDKGQRRIPFDYVKGLGQSQFFVSWHARRMLDEVMSSCSKPNALRKLHKLKTLANAAYT